MFSKDVHEEIKVKTREINKLKTQEERVDSISKFRDSLYARINEEIDELLSNINLKKTREEE